MLLIIMNFSGKFQCSLHSICYCVTTNIGPSRRFHWIVSSAFAKESSEIENYFLIHLIDYFVVQACRRGSPYRHMT